MKFGSDKDAALTNGRGETKNVTFEFYDIYNRPDTPGAVTKALRLLHSGEITTSERNLEYDGDIYRIQNFITGVSDSLDCQGCFVRLRKKSKSIKVTRDDAEHERELEILPGEKLMETMHFKYFDEARVLVTQVNKDAGTPIKLLDYIANRANLRNMQFSIRMEKQGINKVRQMTQVSRMELSLVTGSTVVDSNPRNSLEKVTSISQFYGGCEIEIIIKNRSIGNGIRPLVTENVLETAEYIQNMFGARTKKARFKGAMPLSKKEIAVDLIDGKMREVVPVSEDALATEMYRAIENAYSKRRDELLAATKDRIT